MQLSKIFKTPQGICASHLEHLAEAILSKNKSSISDNSAVHLYPERVSKQLQLLIKRENLRRSYRKLGRLLRPHQMTGIGKIDIPDFLARNCGNPNDSQTWKGPWASITNPSAIAEVVKRMNCAQYHQAHNTPFGMGPLADAVDRNGDTDIATDIIGGHISLDLPPDTFPETCRILHTLATPCPKLVAPSAQISDEEFIASYKVAKESTSSYPSGRHIGHYKAILHDPILVSLHATIMSIPFQVGIVPDCWKRITDIMLEKKAGDSRCHHL